MPDAPDDTDLPARRRAHTPGQTLFCSKCGTQGHSSRQCHHTAQSTGSASGQSGGSSGIDNSKRKAPVKRSAAARATSALKQMRKGQSSDAGSSGAGQQTASRARGTKRTLLSPSSYLDQRKVDKHEAVRRQRARQKSLAAETSASEQAVILLQVGHCSSITACSLAAACSACDVCQAHDRLFASLLVWLILELR
jgi:hypothetical protein